MAKFREKKKGAPPIPTAALPDIIFILLFFFMVTTKMRKTDLKVEAKTPEITQIQKIDDSKQQVDIYVGYPKDAATYGSEPVVQVNDKFIEVKQLRQFINEELAKMSLTKRSKTNMIVSLKVDETVQMGLVIDIKQELRDIGVRSINYASVKKKDIAL